MSAADTGAPVAEALVSDGHTFARTDAAGRYRLPLADAARWVMLINPPGYQPDASLYMVLAESPQPCVRADFTLTALGHPADEPFTFVHLSDSHIASPYRGERMRIEYVEAINRMPRRPAFVLDSGDLCINAPEQLKIAARVNRYYRMPYMATLGNHDQRWRDTFEALLRPSYHAFTFHCHLFISLPWQEEAATAYAWVRQLLETFSDARHVLVSVHHPEAMGDQADRFMSLFRDHGVGCMFMGHYHANQSGMYAGVPLSMVRGSVARNCDMGRPAFNLVETFPDGRINIQQRDVDQRRALSLVSPDAGGAFYRDTQQAIWVSAYDTAIAVRQIRASIYEGTPEGKPLVTFDLDQCSAYLWSGTIVPAGIWPSQVYLLIEAEDETGDRWETIHVVRPVVDSDQRPLPQSAGQARTPAATDRGDTRVTLSWIESVRGSFGFSAPALRDGTLYLGVEHVAEPQRKNPILLAIDAVTGRRLWQYEDRGRCVRTTPLVTDRLVVVQADDGRVIALSRVTGTVEWVQDCLRSEGALGQIYNRSSPILVGDADVVVGSAHLYSRLSLADGRAKWSPTQIQGTRGTASPSPALADDRIITIQKTVMRALHADSGAVCWQRKFQGAHTTPVVVGATLYALVNGSEEAATPWSQERWHTHVVAMESRSGDIRWTQPLRHCGQALCSPLAMGDTLVVVDYDELVGLDRDSGDVQWRCGFSQAISEHEYLISREMTSAALYHNASDGLIVGAPVVDGFGRVCLVSRMGTVIAIDLHRRACVWSYPLNTSVLAGPVVAGNTIYVAASNGGLYALVDRGD